MPLGDQPMVPSDKSSGQSIAVNSKTALEVEEWQQLEGDCMNYFASHQQALSQVQLNFPDYIDSSMGRQETAMYTRLRPTKFRLINHISEAVGIEMIIDDAHGELLLTPVFEVALIKENSECSGRGFSF